MSESRALFIAITGGIGSGKSTVSNIIREHGYSVISADEVARHVIENDENVKTRLIVEYGNATFLPNGTLNTAHLSSLVFSKENKEKIKKLNSIVHPATLDAIIDMAEKLDEQGEKCIFAEIALLYESGLEDAFDYVIAVAAPEEIRIQRVIQRNPEMTKEQIQLRIKEQADQGWVKNQADFVIENDAGLDKLEDSIHFILGLIPHLPVVYSTDDENLTNDDTMEDTQ
ncbi:MAG TPA: dephospho-CoA kinase [Candidatus Kapabacteria bacterium]|jgi:dephospho-CoA kinase|nr:dephospho-CoA kinase [Ignavibacteria bacterium]HRE56878.1 dephospho-CoA kinase [Candidatus Kapabacteria bacterium]HRK59654.1 dephospho-CoA kinase [Candidatus Kapabacteria bacterium]